MNLALNTKRLLCAIVASAAITACNSPAPSPPDPPQIQRLARIHLAQLQSESPEARNLQSSGTWDVSGAIKTENAPGGLRLHIGTEATELSLDVALDASDYSEFIVRMRLGETSETRRAANQAIASFRWTGAIEPNPTNRNRVVVPVFMDGEFHSYRFLLRQDAAAWYGPIEHLVFVPSDHAAFVEIEQMELSYTPPAAPNRITLNNDTREVLFASQESIPLTLPAEPQFECYVGMGELGWENDTNATDGATFIVEATTATGTHEILRRTLDPANTPGDQGWHRLSANLDEFAGQTLTLHLRVDAGESTLGDYTFWGGPTLFSRKPNDAATPIILISNDTLRADHLSSYGYHRPTSPVLDKFCNDAVRFENATCPASFTLLSHATMLTGLQPKNHGVTVSTTLREEVNTLAETLTNAGYLAAGFVGHEGWLRETYGFSHGFDLYSRPSFFRNIESTHALGERWLDQHPLPNVFLFLHNYDIHGTADILGSTTKHPYYPFEEKHLHFARALETPPLFRFEDPEMPVANYLLQAMSWKTIDYGEAEVDYLKALYDDSIRYVDGELGKLFASLKDRGLYDKALIIVTADHGEEFGDHGYFGHANIYEECHHVPLIIKFPSGEFAGQTLTDVVQLADIYPTILDTVGLPDTGAVDGQSLHALLAGTGGSLQKGYGERFDFRVLRTPKWSLVWNMETDTRELFDITSPATLHRDVATDHPAIVDELFADLSAEYQRSQEGWHIVFRNDNKDRHLEVKLTAWVEAPFEKVQFLYDETHEPDTNWDTYEVSHDRRTIQVTSRLWNKDQEELVLRPTADGQRLRVAISASHPIVFLIGDQVTAPTRGIQAVLDPAEKPYPKNDVGLTTENPQPRVAIWYVPLGSARPAAAPMDAAAREQLNALGYFTE